ncbi:MAG TPA: hypothetical protein VHA14_12385 [Bryobacteraceae bacterium]|nr:hypothetical protein [Bryobacteraceae bacterium]
MDYISLFMLSLHIVSAVTLVGGAIAWRFASLPGLQLLDPAVRTKVENAAAAAWRPVVFGAIAGVLVSGIYNFMHRPVKTPAFHMLFGIKMLLALHVFAVWGLAAKPDNAKRSRQLTGVVISGILILIISAAFRWV